MYFYSINCLSYLNLVGGLSCIWGLLTLLQIVAIVLKVISPLPARLPRLPPLPPPHPCMLGQGAM